ncbi:MAG: DUF131 domain-containing protein [Candidatus Bathyarchaeia archaeon]
MTFLADEKTLAHQLLFTLGLALTILGAAITLMATMLMAFRSFREGRARGGGVVMIGPLPIIFGSDAKAVKWLIVLTIVLMVIAFTLMLLSSTIV